MALERTTPDNTEGRSFLKYIFWNKRRGEMIGFIICHIVFFFGFIQLMVNGLSGWEVENPVGWFTFFVAFTLLFIGLVWLRQYLNYRSNKPKSYSE